MPPRSAKKASGGSATAKKPVTRIAKAAQNSAAAGAKAEEPAQVEVAPAAEPQAEAKPQEAVKGEEKQAPADTKPDTQANGSAPPADADEEVDDKEAYDDDDKGERLELDDNDAEYEGEEYPSADADGPDEEVEYEEIEERDVGDEEEMEEMDDDEEDAEGEEENPDGHEVDAEEEEHHDVVQERRKRKEFEIFVGGLDKDATEDDLKKVFSAVGEIKEVRLMMNPQTKKNKGFAFLRFATVEEAKRAVVELKNPVVNGKQCGVSPSQDNDTLFLGNINKAWTKDELKERLKHYAIENVDDMTLVEDTNNKGMNRGFAFLEFASRTEAMEAFRRLHRRGVTFGVDRTAKVAFADTFIEPDDEIMAQVKTVFVDGLPASWDEDRVKDYLKKFGDIEKIELARNMPSAKRKDFGFVTFEIHDAAVACAEGINNAELGEGDNKVKVRARLSRPHQKGRGRRGPRGDFRISRGGSRGGRPWSSRPLPRRVLIPSSRSLGVRSASGARIMKRPISLRDRRAALAASERVRRPPPARSYERRPPAASYPKSSSKMDFARRALPPRSRAPVEYPSRVHVERRTSYRDEYPSRGAAYSDIPRSSARTVPRRAYADEDYGRRIERSPPTYRESRMRDYDPVPGTKRPYSTLEDAPPRYADVSVRPSRARMEYSLGSSAQYADTYSERPGRSHLGYGSSRSTLSGQESQDYYGSSRQGMDYGSTRSSDVGGVYSSSYGSGYLSRRSDVGGSSYSSLYPERSLGGSGSYMGGSSTGTYY